MQRSTYSLQCASECHLKGGRQSRTNRAACLRRCAARFRCAFRTGAARSHRRAGPQNFACSIVDSQLTGRLADAAGNPTPAARTLDALDRAFTAVFAAELAVNMASNLWARFAHDPWCPPPPPPRPPPRPAGAEAAARLALPDPHPPR